MQQRLTVSLWHDQCRWNRFKCQIPSRSLVAFCNPLSLMLCSHNPTVIKRYSLFRICCTFLNKYLEVIIVSAPLFHWFEEKKQNKWDHTKILVASSTTQNHTCVFYRGHKQSFSCVVLCSCQRFNSRPAFYYCPLPFQPPCQNPACRRVSVAG